MLHYSHNTIMIELYYRVSTNKVVQISLLIFITFGSGIGFQQKFCHIVILISIYTFLLIILSLNIIYNLCIYRFLNL